MLSRALLGSKDNWVLVDTVCARCNDLFSVYERRWISQPIVSYARIMYGPEGRTRKRQAFVTHPSQNWFLVAEGDPVCYEVDVERGYKPRFRVQIISTPDGLEMRAGDEQDPPRFKKAFDAFLRKPEITVQKRVEKGKQQYRVAVLDLSMDKSIVVRIELREQPTPIWLDRFPRTAVAGAEIRKDPRVSVDPQGRLRFRVAKLRDIGKLLDHAFAVGSLESDGGSIAAGQYTLINRDFAEIDPNAPSFRAIAKTAVNYAVFEFGAVWMESENFRQIREYCVGKFRASDAEPYVGLINLTNKVGIGEIDNIQRDRHALALISNGDRLLCLIRLYGGPVYKVHLGRVPPGTGRLLKWVHIDYNGVGRVPKP